MSYTSYSSPLSLPLPNSINAQNATPPVYSQLPSAATHLTLPSKPTSETRSKKSWVETLRSQTRSNCFHEAISTFMQMHASGVESDNFAFPAVLKAVTGIKHLDLGKQIHGSVVKLGYDSRSVTVANTLLHMYAKCGYDADQAFKVFDRIPERDQVSWNSMINALCKHEEWEFALDAIRLMGLEGIEPSSFTLVSVSNACSNLNRLDGLRLGKQVHGYSLRVDDKKTYTNNSLMAKYAKLGRINDAKNIFLWFTHRDMVSWNTVISSLSQNYQFHEALQYFTLMQNENFKPDGVTISSVLPACSRLELLDFGKEIHAYLFRNDDLIRNPYVSGALVDTLAALTLMCSFPAVGLSQWVYRGRFLTRPAAATSF